MGRRRGGWSLFRGRIRYPPAALTAPEGKPILREFLPIHEFRRRESLVRILRIRSRLAVIPVIFLTAAALTLFIFSPTEKALAQEAPKYQVEPSWPKELPNNWIMGQVGGMA